jgi:glycerate 2-kinase
VFIKNRGELMTLSGALLLVEALEAALEAADPYRAVLRHVKRIGVEVEVAGRRYSLSGAVHVVGFGKASLKMAQAVVDILGDVVTGGVVISPVGGGSLGPVEVLRGDHPLPGENTLHASQRLLQYLEGVGEGDLLFVLISGGGSALFEAPEEGVSLQDIAWVAEELMRRGADIVELNAVRKRLSAVKGGKLLRRIGTRRVVSLIISDVVGDRLDTIASGPAAPDETTREHAVAVLRRYGLWEEMPPHLRSAVLRSPDTVKPGDPLLERVHNVVVASNLQSLLAASQHLADRGFNVVVLSAALEGEAREVGRVLASAAKSAAWFGHPAKPPAALLAGGETVVRVRGRGVGGRNQELCLSFAVAARGLPVSAACIGTDGVDGNSPAAGALVDGYTAEEAERAGLNPLEHLDNNDSFTLFHRLGRAIYTGPTGTNVNDIFIALVYKT